MNNIKTKLDIALQAAFEAGEAILSVYQEDFEVMMKDDQSPLTLADLASNSIILKNLGDDFPILTEENKEVPFQERKYWTNFWLIDPLDGTKEFIKRNGEFTVNIAFISHGKPVLGIVYVPVSKQFFWGTEMNGSFTYTLQKEEHFQTNQIINKGISLNQSTLPEVFTIVASRSHLSPETEHYIEQYRRKHERIALVSSGSSLKLCMIAARQAHVYPRLAPTMEWDTAAAHAVVKFAGCNVYNFETREELAYNKENLLNPWFVVEHN